MPLDTQARYVLDLIASAGRPPVHTVTPDEARLAFNFKPLAGPPEDVASVRDRFIPGPAGEMQVRVYTPGNGGSGGVGMDPLPVLVYFHGGGWVIGDIEAADVPCRRIANRARCVVVSLEYRRAPEHRFPAAADDAYASVQWLAQHGAELGVDTRRIAIGGDSAGGNLAAVVALMAKERGEFAPCFQLLLYPVTNHAFDTDSYRDNGDGYLLTRDSMAWFWQHYLGDADGQHPHASPLLASDHGGLPPALVITAEYDPLRDEGEAYAHRLAAAGTPVELKRYDGAIHGFCWMPGVLQQGAQALDHAADALQRAFLAHA